MESPGSGASDEALERALSEANELFDRLEPLIDAFLNDERRSPVGTRPPRSMNVLLRFARRAERLGQQVTNLGYEKVINREFHDLVLRIDDTDNYERKKFIIKQINGMLRTTKVVIRHPESGRPCKIYAVASRDGRGRYVLQDVETKKRSLASKSLKPLLPFRFIPESALHGTN